MASKHINLLRKYQKPILAVLGVVCMITFVLGPFLLDLIGSFGGGGGRKHEQDPVVVTWVGGKVRQSDLQTKRAAHQMAVNFCRLVIAKAVENGGQPIVNGQAIPKGTPTAQVMQMDPGIGDDSSDGQVVSTMLLAKKADEMGIVVDVQAAHEFVESLGVPDVQPDEWPAILDELTKVQGMAISLDQVLAQIALDLKARHAIMLSQAGLGGIPPGLFWDYHNRLNRRYTIEAYPIDVAGFGGQVQGEPSNSELQTMFDKGKTFDPNPASPEPGFHLPHKVAFQWLRIDRTPFVEAAMKKITDEEVAKKYELDITQGKHKVLELPPDPTKPAKPSDDAKPGETKPSDAKPGDAKPGDSKPEEGKPGDKPADKSAEDKPAAEKPAAGEADKKPCDQEQPTTGDEKADEKKTENKKPDETKPAESNAGGAKPTDSKPGAAPPASTPPDTTSPAAVPPGSTPPATPAPPPKFKPLAEVKEEIRKELAQPIAEDEIKAAVKKATDEINTYGRKYRRWKSTQDAVKEGVKAGNAEDPGELDVAAIAARYGFKSGSTELVDQHEIANYEIGQKVVQIDFESFRITRQFRQLSFADLAFRGGDVLYSPSPEPVNSTEPDVSYVYWRTAEEETKEPTLDDVRKQVVEAWKLGKAFELAKADAQKLADKAKGAASLKDVVADPTKVVTTIPFSWMTTGSLAFGSGAPELSAVPGLDLAGADFMEAVFALKPGETGVAPNQPHRKLYVVRVVSQEPTDDTLREQFLESGAGIPTQYVAMFDRQRILGEWFSGLEKEMGLVWQRPPVETARR